MDAEVRWLIHGLLFSAIYYLVEANLPHRKFEYKYSFKPPYLAQKDGSVPFWQYGGNAIASAENVRVAPSLRSQKGAIWTKSRTNFDWWEVELVFRVSGRGRIGADGLAFWYTDKQGAYDGEVFGSEDKWVGLAVFFDSFDNDNKHNNPYIMAMVNDGTKNFDHANDGSSQILSGCVKDFRNKPFPTRARIEYYMNTLTVLFHNGMTNNEKDYEICLRVENLYLPKTGYFGVSAATGGLADDHDVIHFLTTSLYPPGSQPQPAAGAAGGHRLSSEEEVKIAKEYEEYQKKLDHQKEEYKKEHPKDPNEFAFDEYFESDSQRELKLITSGNLQIIERVDVVNRKLDEVIGRQERALSLISALHQSGGGGGGLPQHQQIPGQAGVPQPVMVDSIRRHEVDALIANQNNLIAQARELRGFLVEIQTKADNLLMKAAGSGGTGTVTSVDGGALREIREALAALRSQQQQQQPQQQYPGAAGLTAGCPAGVSPLLLFLALAGHLVILFLYSLYRDNKGAQAKKLF